MPSKSCFCCGKTKQIEDFYKHLGMADGRLNKCKECCKKQATARRWSKIEEIRAYDRGRGNRQPKGYLKDYRKKFPSKYKAHSAVNNALRDGKITRGVCEVCGTDKNIEAHHDDYAKPLEVRWLCAAHHKQWHRDNGEAANPF